MGVASIASRETGEIFIMSAANVSAAFNRMQFQLSSGMCPNRHLQEPWSRHGKTLSNSERYRILTTRIPLMATLTILKNS